MLSSYLLYGMVFFCLERIKLIGKMNTFSVADDKTLIELITQARRRLVYLAPGVSEPIARAIAQRLPEQGLLDINLILDLDPEVYRLGYGTVEGLDLLQKAVIANGSYLRSQPGLRIGLVISDERLLVFTPIPLLVEAGSTSPAKPNAISLGEHPAEQLAAATGASAEMLLSQAEIGQAPVTPEQVMSTLDELKRIPPKPFDLQRIQRVFSSRVQYVEVEVMRYRLAGRAVPLPKDLLVADREIQRRLKNSFKLFDNPDAIEVMIEAPVITPAGERKEKLKLRYGQRVLEDDRRRLTERWLYSVHGYGMLLFREDRARFDQEIEAFTERVAAYGQSMKCYLESHDQVALDPILGGLVETVMKEPPSRYALNGIDIRDRSALANAIRTDLDVAFKDLRNSINPKVTVVYKEVSYESLSDPQFRKGLEEALRRKNKQALVDELFSEYDAVREKSGCSKGTSATGSKPG